MKLWAGRFSKEIDKKTNDFNSSISFDSRMYREDIEGSIAHATMLGECGIIEKSESEAIIKGLEGILADIDSGKLLIDPNAEDIHTFIEGELTERLGQTGKRLHTARSRNDQVAVDIRLYLKKEVKNVKSMTKELVEVIARALVDHPDQVSVKETEREDAIVVELSVAPTDMGKVIGKSGKIARAIRSVVKAASVQSEKKVIVEIE